MCPRDLSRPRGRPRASLIADPVDARRRGERACAAALAEYPRKLRYFGPKRCKPPKQPTCDLDRGLLYARYADLVHPQAVRHILARTRVFEAWMREQRGARGPGPDAEKVTRLYLAIETIRSIRQKRAKETEGEALGDKRPASEAPATREVQKALELLFAETPTARAVKERHKDLRPRLAQFEAARKAALRERRKTKRADGRACSGAAGD